MIVLGVLLGLFLLWARRRAVRRTEAGLNSAKPVFQITPPGGRINVRKTEVL